VIVVGGPQYRVGSHRQFVLMARALATKGVASLRFDCRGMGDSEGPRLGFGQIGADLAAAVGTLCKEIPSLTGVVLWGLCDGASAIAFYAPGDPRILGVALFNPWVRTPSVEAEALIRHYYPRRVLKLEFWTKLLGGGINPRNALRDLTRTAHRALGAVRPPLRPMSGDASLSERVAGGLARYAGEVLIGLSGNDRVAEEFRLAAAKPGHLADALRCSRPRVVELPDADHTFSSQRLQDVVAGVTLTWMRECFAGAFVETAAPIHSAEWR
jgi:uncharacterized protein